MESERDWVVQGSDEELADVQAVLPASRCERIGSGALLLKLVNCVGVLKLPHVGAVELYTGKLGEDAFEALLADLTELATSLPFSPGDPGSSPYAGVRPPREEVLYHAFVYLRHILSERAPAETQLIPALQLIQSEPHRLWRTERRDVRIEALTRVDSRTLLDLVTRAGTPVRPSSLSPTGARLRERLGGRLPEAVSERKIRATIDTPENRFVKAFVGQAQGIIGRIRCATASGSDVFKKNLLGDCDRMEASLRPVVRHSMWEEVGTMARIPFSSTVLQRRRGYRQVLRHFAKIRLAPRIPLDKRQMRDLLELKDIARLYELWTFFRLAKLICERLGTPARRAHPTGDEFKIWLEANRTFEWESGIRLVYNEPFSRSGKRPAHSYSVLLRPDIALHVADGPNRGLHLLDAKFRVQTPDGDFKPDDLYKMHAYRDAIPAAHSVWILYPGSEFRFFDASGDNSARSRAEDLPESIRGVGAIPFAPRVSGASGASLHCRAAATLGRLIGRPPKLR